MLQTCLWWHGIWETRENGPDGPGDRKQHTAVVLLYLILGILLFSITFMILQEPYIRYISKISDAVQNISEGNLNTVIECDRG